MEEGQEGKLPVDWTQQPGGPPPDPQAHSNFSQCRLSDSVEWTDTQRKVKSGVEHYFLTLVSVQCRWGKWGEAMLWGSPASCMRQGISGTPWLGSPPQGPHNLTGLHKPCWRLSGFKLAELLCPCVGLHVCVTAWLACV